MVWRSSADAMPWVGLYVIVASLICILAMAADAIQGFRQRKLWFPCRFFTINSASITLIAIATKLPVDLSNDLTGDDDTRAKFIGVIFLITMLANFLPSLGLMDDKELTMNVMALGILIITITVNVWIQMSTTSRLFIVPKTYFVLLFSLPWPFSVALTVSASRRILQHRYEELRRSDYSKGQEINFSCKGLTCYVKKHWMMAVTGDPQFAIASSPVSSAFGVTCLLLTCDSVFALPNHFNKSIFEFGESDYKWAIKPLASLQLIGAIVGSIAPILRCLTATSHFDLSAEWSKNHLNVFRVEKHWTQTLQMWKRSHVPSHIPGRHFKKVFHVIRNMIFNFCIALQIMFVVMCKTVCLIPRTGLILLSLLKRCMCREEPDTPTSYLRSEMEEYSDYVLQIEPEAKLSNRILKNALNSINRLLHESEKKEPSNLINLLNKSTGFHGVINFDNDQVLPLLHPEETQNCWSLVAITLSAIALALPNIAISHMKELLASMREGLELVKHIEECLKENGELVKSRKAARRVWTDVEVYGRWLQIDLQKKARKGKMTKEILKCLGDEAAKIVIQFKRSKDGSLDHSLHKFIAASSMYRISQTILLHCNEQQNWPTDEEVFELISTIIADLLCACFTNLPRVITMKCHEDEIENREDSIRSAAQLLGRSKKILKLLKARKLPNLDMDSMGYIDKWHALRMSQIPDGSTSLPRTSPASSSSNESLVVTII